MFEQVAELRPFETSTYSTATTAITSNSAGFPGSKPTSWVGLLNLSPKHHPLIPSSSCRNFLAYNVLDHVLYYNDMNLYFKNIEFYSCCLITLLMLEAPPIQKHDKELRKGRN